MSKKIIALCLALVMVLSMTACSAPAQTAEPEQTAEPATKASTAETPTADARPVIGSAIQYDPNVPINDGKDIEVELWFWSGAANLFQSLADQYSFGNMIKVLEPESLQEKIYKWLEKTIEVYK